MIDLQEFKDLFQQNIQLHRHKGIDSPQIDANDLLNKSVAEWTYAGKVTYSNSSTQQNYNLPAVHDYWKVIFKLTFVTSAGGSLFVDILFNGLTAANYTWSAHQNSTLSVLGGTTSIAIIHAAAAEDNRFDGEYIITGKHYGGRKSLFGQGSGGTGSNDGITMTGRQTGDSNDLTSVSIVPTNAISGIVEFWYKDNK